MQNSVFQNNVIIFNYTKFRLILIFIVKPSVQLEYNLKTENSNLLLSSIRTFTTYSDSPM